MISLVRVIACLIVLTLPPLACATDIDFSAYPGVPGDMPAITGTVPDDFHAGSGPAVECFIPHIPGSCATWTMEVAEPVDIQIPYHFEMSLKTDGQFEYVDLSPVVRIAGEADCGNAGCFPTLRLNYQFYDGSSRQLDTQDVTFTIDLEAGGGLHYPGLGLIVGGIDSVRLVAEFSGGWYCVWEDCPAGELFDFKLENARMRTVAVVPEPPPATLVAAGIAGLVILRRRWRPSSHARHRVG